MQITDGAAKQVLRVSLLRRSLYHLSSLYEQGAAFWEAAERGNLPVPSSALTDAHFRSDFPYPRNVKINPALWWGFSFVFAIPRIFLPRKTEAETRPAGTKGGLRTPESDSWLDF
ncbi:hypothetical protein [Burkholderia cepacia]|uniref:hypothetical protein n=1 Tax=Burkholderia cepacia TaxID=292 RepID=UPI00158D780E|nr:hypothetical protein [Burkholderia cepacia]